MVSGFCPRVVLRHKAFSQDDKTMAANHPMSLFSCSIQFHLNDVLLMVTLHMQVIVNSRNTTSYAEQLKLVSLLA